MMRTPEIIYQKNMLKSPYVCYKNERYSEKAEPMNKENAKYLLNTIASLYDKHGIKLLLAYGTLLGAIREHDFIGHDADMDTQIWAKDLQKALELTEELEKYDIHLHCYVLPWIFTYEYKGVTCDIDVMWDAAWPWKNYLLVEEKYMPCSLFEKTKQIEFQGCMHTIPEDAERLLVYHYGPNWRIPSGRHARIESYMFFWRYAHRFIERTVRYLKKHL